jgi:hypothetical protein
MTRIGLLGARSWESSLEDYGFVEEVRDRLGGLHSADCLLRFSTSLRSRSCSAPPVGTRPPSS